MNREEKRTQMRAWLSSQREKNRSNGTARNRTIPDPARARRIPPNPSGPVKAESGRHNNSKSSPASSRPIIPSSKPKTGYSGSAQPQSPQTGSSGDRSSPGDPGGEEKPTGQPGTETPGRNQSNKRREILARQKAEAARQKSERKAAEIKRRRELAAQQETARQEKRAAALKQIQAHRQQASLEAARRREAAQSARKARETEARARREKKAENRGARPVATLKTPETGTTELPERTNRQQSNRTRLAAYLKESRSSKLQARAEKIRREVEGQAEHNRVLQAARESKKLIKESREADRRQKRETAVRAELDRKTRAETRRREEEAARQARMEARRREEAALKAKLEQDRAAAAPIQPAQPAPPTPAAPVLPKAAPVKAAAAAGKKDRQTENRLRLAAHLEARRAAAVRTAAEKTNAAREKRAALESRAKEEAAAAAARRQEKLASEARYREEKAAAEAARQARMEARRREEAALKAKLEQERAAAAPIQPTQPAPPTPTAPVLPKAAPVKAAAAAGKKDRQAENRLRLAAYLQEHRQKKGIPASSPVKVTLPPARIVPKPTPPLFLLKPPVPRKPSALAARPVPVAPVSKKVIRPFDPVNFLKTNYIRAIFALLILGWFVEIFMLNQRLDQTRRQVEEALAPPAKSEAPEAPPEMLAQAPRPQVIRVEGLRDPFSHQLWRLREITSTPLVRIVRIPNPPGLIRRIPIIRPPEPPVIPKPTFVAPNVPPAIPESEKISRIPPISVQLPEVTLPAKPGLTLHFRGTLNLAGVDYFFLEGPDGGYRARVGDTVAGYKIYDYRNGVLYLAREGHTYQINEERLSPPLRYKGRLIMAGEEYFFLEGQKTYRAIIGEEIEGFRLVRRIGNYLYFVRDDRLYFLKQE